MPSKLGQNFLKNKEVVRKDYRSCQFKHGGFGFGNRSGKRCFDWRIGEKSRESCCCGNRQNLVGYLKDKFKNIENVEIIEKDVLKINLKSLVIGHQSSKFCNYKLIANIPYYITLQSFDFFWKWISAGRNDFDGAKGSGWKDCGKTRTTQYLVIVGSILCETRIVFYVSKNDFDPIPEVDSAVIKIVLFLQLPLPPGEGKERAIKVFFRIVKSGFCAKRKP